MMGLATVRRACLLGMASGMRSMTGPAAVSWAAMTGRLTLDDSPLAFLGDPDIATVCVLLAAGEVVADKLPFLPNRTAPLPLIGRMGMGAMAGAAVFRSDGRSSWRGGVIGAVAAAASAFVTYRGRMFLLHRMKVPNPLAGILGDALALTLTRAAVASSCVR